MKKISFPGYIYFEILWVNRNYYLAWHAFILLCFSHITLALIGSKEELNNLSQLIFLLLLPLIMLNLQHYFYKEDFRSGRLEILLSLFTPLQIAITRYLAITCSVLLAFAGNLLLSSLLFSYNITQINNLILTLPNLILTCCAYLSLLNAASCYFKTNSHHLIALFFPLIMPCLILIGLYFNEAFPSAPYLLLAINLFFVPICWLSASYLISNIYHS